MRIIEQLLISLIIILGSAETPVANDSTYWAVRVDPRLCMYPLCGGYWVKKVNRDRTRYAGRQNQKEYYVADLDWSGSGFSEQQVSELNSKIGMTLFCGTLGETYFEGFDAAFNKLMVTKVWLSVTGRAIPEMTKGRFIRISDNGIRCITTPCASIDQVFLNTRFSFSIHEVDFSLSEAGEEQIADGISAIYDTEDGLPAFGFDSLYLENAVLGIRFSALEFYLPIRAHEMW